MTDKMLSIAQKHKVSFIIRASKRPRNNVMTFTYCIKMISCMLNDLEVPLSVLVA